MSGQIYMPRVNTLLLIGVLLLVSLFRSSSALASAYGIAVTGTMVVDGHARLHRDLAAVELDAGRRRRADRAVPGDRPHLPRRQPAEAVRGRLGAAAARLAPDAGHVYVAARHPDPLEKTRRSEVPLDSSSTIWRRSRRSGCRAPLCSSPAIRTSAPTSLLHSLKHYKVLHEHNVILTVETADTPRVADGRARAHRAHRRALFRAWRCASASWRRRTCRRRSRSRASSAGSSTSCRRRSSCRGARSSPRRIRACRAGRTSCSSILARNANDATDYFQIPTGRVVEVGTQVAV